MEISVECPRGAYKGIACSFVLFLCSFMYILLSMVVLKHFCHFCLYLSHFYSACCLLYNQPDNPTTCIWYAGRLFDKVHSTQPDYRATIISTCSVIKLLIGHCNITVGSGFNTSYLLFSVKQFDYNIVLRDSQFSRDKND